MTEERIEAVEVVAMVAELVALNQRQAKEIHGLRERVRKLEGEIKNAKTIADLCKEPQRA